MEYKAEEDSTEYESEYTDVEFDHKVPGCELNYAIEDDDKDDFLCLVDAQVPEYTIFPPDVMYEIARNNALKCAKAVLEGETKFKKVDFAASVEHSDCLPPLHSAAQCMRPDMIDLFLSYGAPTDLRCIAENQHNKMLPLNMILGSIRTHLIMWDWTPKRSVFDLISRLCLPQMRSALEALKLLAHKTPETLVGEEICHYAKAGRVVELAALLMVAREKVLFPSILQNICSSGLAQTLTLRQFITSEITLLIGMKMRSENTVNYQWARACKDKHMAMMSLLLLTEVFGRVGEELTAYLKLERPQGSENQVGEEVAWLLKEAGFTLKHEDIDLNHVNVSMLYCEFGLKNGFWKRRFTDQVGWYNLDSIRRGEKMLHGRPAECKLEDLAMPQCLEPGSFQAHSFHGNARSQRWALRDSLKEPSWIIDTPYEQWRFSSTMDQHGSQSFCVRLLDTLSFLKDIPYDDKVNSHCSVALNESIETLCHHQYLNDWSPEKSVNKLLYILCQPELEENLKHVRLVACNTEEIEALGCYYAREGRIIQLAVLLMVAREKLIPLIAYWSIDDMNADRSMVIRRSVMSEIQKLIDEEISLVGRSRSCKMVRKCKDKKETMLSALLLLEVFERVGKDIEWYLNSKKYETIKKLKIEKEQVAKDVALILKKSGFIIKRQDTYLKDLNCFSYKLGSEQSENLWRSLRGETGLPLNSQLDKFSVMKRILPHTALSPCSSSVSCPPGRSFHTFQISKSCVGFLQSTYLENRVNRALGKSEQRLLNHSSGKQWAFFAMALKRAMRRLF